MTREEMLQKASAVARDMLQECTALSDAEFDEIVRRGMGEDEACSQLAISWLEEAAFELAELAKEDEAARKPDGQGS